MKLYIDGVWLVPMLIILPVFLTGVLVKTFIWEKLITDPYFDEMDQISAHNVALNAPRLPSYFRAVVKFWI